ncbi:hypothetical protein ACHQM5_007877 [Ranunculus cassubicifolius]
MRRPHQYFNDFDEASSAMLMDVDDNEDMIMGDGLLTHVATKLQDADFFNSFEDDFDDAEIRVRVWINWGF